MSGTLHDGLVTKKTNSREANKTLWRSLFLRLAFVEDQSVISEILACIALGVSALAGLLAVLSYTFNRRVALVTAMVDRHRTADEMRKENPSLLELHGISQVELEKASATSEELLYLVSSFEAGAAYHRTVGWVWRVKLTEVRVNLLRQEKVRRIWKLFIRDRLLRRDRFSDAVDQCITQLETGTLS